MPGWRVTRKMTTSRIANGILWVAFAITGGCGSGSEETTCNEDGCITCDAYGCRSTSGPQLQANCDPAVASCSCQDSSQCGGNGRICTNGKCVTEKAACDPATTTCPCSGDESCAGGLKCVEGLCLNACQYSSQCGGGRVCINGKCVVGCDQNTPCAAGYTCNSKGVCVPDTGNPQCGNAKICSGGMTCVQGVCRGGCKQNAECAPGEICDMVTSSCIADPQPKSCTKDPSLCSSAQECVNGYCRYPCKDSQTCIKVDVRLQVCKDDVCWTAAEANPQCTKKQDCPEGKDCLSNACL